MEGVVALMVLFLAAAPAFATDYTVGDANGWNTNVDYNSWVTGKTFKVGDTLLFQYTSLHTVAEVTQSDYTGCSASNSIQTYNNQNTKITLTAPANRYFICGTAGHCSQGMKLAVTVAGSSPNSPPSPPGTPNPSTPSSPTTPPPPTTKSAAIGGGFHGGNAMLLGVLLVGFALLG